MRDQTETEEMPSARDQTEKRENAICAPKSMRLVAKNAGTCSGRRKAIDSPSRAIRRCLFGSPRNSRPGRQANCSSAFLSVHRVFSRTTMQIRRSTSPKIGAVLKTRKPAVKKKIRSGKEVAFIRKWAHIGRNEGTDRDVGNAISEGSYRDPRNAISEGSNRDRRDAISEGSDGKRGNAIYAPKNDEAGFERGRNVQRSAKSHRLAESRHTPMSLRISEKFPTRATSELFV